MQAHDMLKLNILSIAVFTLKVTIFNRAIDTFNFNPCHQLLCTAETGSQQLNKSVQGKHK